MVDGTTRSAGLEEILKRDRAIVVYGLAGIAVLAWAYIIYLAWDMSGMDMGMKMAMPRIQTWSAVDFALTFVMWAVMMVAMMVPSAAPMVLVFALINRKRREQQRPFVTTGLFLSSYLVVWAAFSALATTAQWGLQTAALVSPMMVSTSPILGAGLLLAAGVFQLTPLKYACLHHCRDPLGHLMTEWREGARGAFVMGFKHGVYCTGCCWALMALLFVAGVMNLLWVAIIAGFVLVEKIAPGGRWVSRVSGLLLVVWGAWMLMKGLG